MLLKRLLGSATKKAKKVYTKRGSLTAAEMRHVATVFDAAHASYARAKRRLVRIKKVMNTKNTRGADDVAAWTFLMNTVTSEHAALTAQRQIWDDAMRRMRAPARFGGALKVWRLPSWPVSPLESFNKTTTSLRYDGQVAAPRWKATRATNHQRANAMGHTYAKLRHTFRPRSS